MDLPSIPENVITGIVEEVKAKLANPLVAAAAGGSLGLGVGVATASVIKRKKKRSKRKSKKKSSKRKKSKNRDWRYASRQKHEVNYRKRRKKAGKKSYQKKYETKKSKSSSRKGIHYTKNGQPYKILSSGRARFIKKRRKS
jgi:hypothetical protein